MGRFDPHTWEAMPVGAGATLPPERREDLLGALVNAAVRALPTEGFVLDVGCGSGQRLARLAEAAATARAVVGIDPDPLRVSSCRTRGLPAFVGEPCALPVVDQRFDVVVASETLLRVDDLVRAARELVRVTLPGGALVLADPVRPAAASRQRGLRYRPTTLRRVLEAAGCRVEASPGPVLVVRLPGPRTGAMPIRVTGLAGWDRDRVAALLDGLPVARGYEVVVKPLRYRTRPHVQAFCEFEAKRITIQVPVPFRAFSEIVPYRAKRVSAKGLRFRWFVRRLRFDRPDELIRYLYLHEYYHWYLRECLGKASGAETACDRFALQRL